MQRIIFLVDMNAFFIGCEMARNPELKGKPAAVAGDPRKRSGIVLAANYEAREYKVKTTMTLHEAQKLCPGIVFVPPDHEFYERKSKEVMSILSRYSPVIQQNSIDEAWVDLTGCEALFGKPLEIANRIMNDIEGELDLWCSIGISENKFLAKMASEIKKPLGIIELWQKDVKEKLWPLPVREMYGIGQKTEKKLKDIGLYTIGDIAAADQTLLIKLFGKYGQEIHRLANGIDPSHVTENPVYDSKSISRSTTLERDITHIDDARSVLLKLAEEVGIEARRQEYKGRTVSIVIKYADFSTITRQKSILPTHLTKEIYQAGVELLDKHWNVKRPVRLLGIVLANMDDENPEQLSLFDLTDSCNKLQKEEKLERTMDKIREKFGHDTVKRAKLLE